MNFGATQEQQTPAMSYRVSELDQTEGSNTLFKGQKSQRQDLNQQYLAQAAILVDMLKQNSKMLIQANQVSVYISNHQTFLETQRLHLVMEGYNKLKSYIKKLMNNLMEEHRPSIGADPYQT